MNKQQRIAAALAAGQSYLNTGRLPKDAKLLGRGAFAAVLAIHGLAVKVQGKGKGYGTGCKRSYALDLDISNSVRYLRAIRDKELTGRHFPKVYALEEPDSVRYVAVMEQLQPGRKAWIHAKQAQWAIQVGEDYGVVRAIQQYTLEQAFHQLACLHLRAADIHSGNVMKRGDTIVLTDVVM